MVNAVQVSPVPLEVPITNTAGFVLILIVVTAPVETVVVVNV